MRHRLVLALLLPAAVAAQPVDARVDSIFAFATPSTPGCAVAAARSGEVLFARGYGTADLEHDVPITRSTPFYLASVSKQFTAAAIDLLVLDGKLSLDDDVRKYVPELPSYGAPITLRHLMTHTSGLRDYLALFSLRGLDDHPITIAEFLETVAKQRALNFPTGEQYSYSNTGYVLLSIVVQRVSGKSLRDFARERIFGPLGMTSTQFRDRHDQLVKDRALAYARAAGGGYRLAVPYFDVVGDGGLFSTVEDLARWEGNFWDPRVGGAEWLTLEAMRGRLRDGTTIAYGAGLQHGVYRGEPIVEHGGSLGGYNTHLLRMPARRFSVAVLCNDNAKSASVLARQVADVFLPDLVAADRPAVAAAPTVVAPASAESVDRYAGAFFNDRTMTVRSISARGGKLYYLRGPTDSVELAPLGAGRFQLTGTPSAVALSRAADTLRLEIPGAPPSAYGRVAPVRTRDWRKYTGTYASDELGVTWRVDPPGGADSAIVLRSALGDSARAVPAFDDAFRAGGLFLRFARDRHGRVTDMLVSAGERARNVRFVRR
ncbi:beta-lactamase [Gemmatirosa kalamazoonensis]|uniref:Beta-lactamase n=1 Tax=Gemmatirosa kalamazoonensis TaxID=861299 RepID=W0REM8_9BACT|nr:serine hydrolase domain-containing protein [Gemmatirosa kalamazoonensis]AHG88902.1 beta-lactamase [Gemmatirosa kalamazoonensis]